MSKWLQNKALRLLSLSAKSLWLRTKFFDYANLVIKGM
jgi:hypothetical protein